MINSLLMNHSDNVVTCVAPVAAGEVVSYLDGDSLKSITVQEDIPFAIRLHFVI